MIKITSFLAFLYDQFSLGYLIVFINFVIPRLLLIKLKDNYIFYNLGIYKKIKLLLYFIILYNCFALLVCLIHTIFSFGFLVSFSTYRVLSYSYNKELAILSIIPLVIYIIIFYIYYCNLKKKLIIRKYLLNILFIFMILLITFLTLYNLNYKNILKETTLNEYYAENRLDIREETMKDINSFFNLDQYMDIFIEFIPWSSNKYIVKKINNGKLLEESKTSLKYLYTLENIAEHKDFILTYFFNKNDKLYKITSDINVTNVIFNNSVTYLNNYGEQCNLSDELYQIETDPTIFSKTFVKYKKNEESPFEYDLCTSYTFKIENNITLRDDACILKIEIVNNVSKNR